MTSMVWIACYNNDALAFWQGTRFIRENRMTVGQVISIILLANQGSFAISGIAPHFRSLSQARSAVAKIFATIDRASVVDPLTERGAKLENVKGEIELRNVKFIYPSRPNVCVLNNFNLRVPAGKTVALVGASGSGKSTIIGLLERFYIPLAGEVLIDGVPIESLNVRWLRQQVSLVSQEPTLFACSIYENIAHGLIGTQYEFAAEHEKRALVVSACEQANAMDFISTFPEGLDTSVGERGFLMSGGQKQRIAIARAIVSNPKILLLDEATSALDTKSEGVVQDALDKAAQGRTTIVIAHRLSTIKDADLIVVMRKGVIIEMGNHHELIEKKSEYFALVDAQKIEQQREALKSQLVQEEPEIEEKHVSLDLSRAKTVSSISSRIIDNTPKKPEIDAAKYTFGELCMFLIDMQKGYNGLNSIGMILSFINGLGYVALGFFYGGAVEAYTHLPDYDFVTHRISIFAGLLFMESIVVSIATSGSQALFSFSSQKLIRRIRYMTFRQILRQDISYFDKDANTAGSLTAMLSQDAQAIEG